MNKNNNIIIKSKYSDNFILAYNIVKNNFRILHEDYAIINNKYITQFIIKHIKNNNYSLVYKYKNEFHNIPIALIFQNNSSFFHILFHNKLLHSDFINNPQNSFKISFKKPIQKFNNKLYKSIFFIQYKYLKPCQITLNNRKYNIFGYNSDINLKNNDKICTYNKKLMNAWKVKPISSCKHINLSKDNIESKITNCALNNKSKTLLNPIPSMTEIFKQYVRHDNKIKAGQFQYNIDKNSNNISKKLNDPTIVENTNNTHKNLDPEYKTVLLDSVKDFNKLEKNEKKNNPSYYNKMLNDIIEQSKLYITREFKSCKNNAYETLCNVKNISDCNRECNKNKNCTDFTYDKNKKLCKFYNSCKLKDNINTNTYTKKSLLRNKGYSIPNAYHMRKNSPIPQMPFILKPFSFLLIVLIILCSSALLYKIFKISYKLIACIFDDSCYVPWVILNPFSFDVPDKLFI